jgi:5,10-methenyltetrahydrofolate synthetase
LEASDLDGWRRAERERLVAERLAMPAQHHASASAAICQHARTRLAALRPRLVGAYWPIRGEVDCRPLLEAIVAEGGAAALPIAQGRGRPLMFRPWTPQTTMTVGRWDIPHPAIGPSVKPDMVLAPMVAFDGAGHRLGYGAGYYDRTLAALPERPLVIGLSFEFARLASIHPQPHDVAMDMVITEAGVFETASKGR